MKITPLGISLLSEVWIDFAGGRKILCWNFDGNFAGDTIFVLEVLIDFAGDKKTSPRTIFPWLLAEDNPVISSSGA